MVTKDTTKTIFQNRLLGLMSANNTKQADLAREIGVTRQAVSKWTTGASTPDLIMATKIANYYGVSLDYFVFETPITITLPRGVLQTKEAVKECVANIGLTIINKADDIACDPTLARRLTISAEISTTDIVILKWEAEIIADKRVRHGDGK